MLWLKLPVLVITNMATAVPRLQMLGLVATRLESSPTKKYPVVQHSTNVQTQSQTVVTGLAAFSHSDTKIR